MQWGLARIIFANLEIKNTILNQWNTNFLKKKIQNLLMILTVLEMQTSAIVKTHDDYQMNSCFIVREEPQLSNTSLTFTAC